MSGQAAAPEAYASGGDRTVLVQYATMAGSPEAVSVDVLHGVSGGDGSPVWGPPGPPGPPLVATAAPGAGGHRYRVVFDPAEEGAGAPDLYVDAEVPDAMARTGYVAVQVGVYVSGRRSWPLGRVRLVMHGEDAGWGHGSCWDPVAGRWCGFTVIAADAGRVDGGRLPACPYCIGDGAEVHG